jgi:hypothetical protein
MLWCLLGLFDVLLFRVFGSSLVLLACARHSRRSLMSPSSELRGTRRVNDVRCAAKIGHANCADHRPLVSEGSSNLGPETKLVVVTVTLADPQGG